MIGAMAMPTAKCTAIILAGGRSSRMGQDKALLSVDGETMLQRTVTLAKAAGCDEVLISRNEPCFIPDIFVAAGPLAGIQSALMHASADRCLVLAIDIPLLSPALVRLLLGHRCSCFRGSPLPAVIPNNSAVQHWLTQQLQPAASSAKQQRQNSVFALLQQFGGVMLDCPDQAALFNSNTPAEWLVAKEKLVQKNPLPFYRQESAEHETRSTF